MSHKPRSTWPNAWDGSHPWHAPPPQPPDTAMLLGRLIERTDHQTGQLDAIGATQRLQSDQLQRIEHRLVRGDIRMTEHERRLDQVTTLATEAATAAKAAADLAAKAAATPPVPAIETWLKELLKYAIPLGALWATGSIDAAKALLAFLKLGGG